MIFGKNVNRYYLRYALPFLLGILTLAAVDFVQLIVPELYRMTVNGINTGTVEVDGETLAFDMPFLLDRICLPLIGILVIMVIGRFLWRLCFFGSAIGIESDLRGRMFRHCETLSQRFYQKNKVGDLMSRFTNDLESVQESFRSGILTAFDALLLGSFSLIKMARMNPFLTFLCMIPMALLLACSIIVGKFMTARWERRQETFSALSDFSQEIFSGLTVIKAFVREARELSRFHARNRENEDANVSYTRMSVLFNGLITLFVESVITVILGYGGYLVYRGTFDAGQLVEFIGYYAAIVWPVMAVTELIELHAQGRASLNRIDELFAATPDVTDRSDVVASDLAKGKIEFRSLSFSYPDSERQILRDVSFTVEAGESVGLVGRTGAGKSTVIDLLLRTYNVPDGTVFLDGADINKIPIRTVRDSIAYVPQDNFLFSDTIASNISFASDSGNAELVESAAKLSDVHENISEFANRYDTVLGERGVTVSGGQKQRISIARALMKNAPILILDDSVSAVDVNTEKVILQNLADSRRGLTTILIAHRVTTVERMDKIVYMENGTVIAVGPHKELYETCPSYRNMVDLQKLDDAHASENEQGGERNV